MNVYKSLRIHDIKDEYYDPQKGCKYVLAFGGTLKACSKSDLYVYACDIDGTVDCIINTNDVITWWITHIHKEFR